MKKVLAIVMMAMVAAVVLAQEIEPIRAVDGDTILVLIDGEEREVDIVGIDAPELDQPFGVEARDRLEALIKEDYTALVWDDVEPEKVHISDTDHNGLLYYGQLFMVSHGLAWASDGWIIRFTDGEMESARRAGRGLWGADDIPVPPLYWRAVERQRIP